MKPENSAIIFQTPGILNQFPASVGELHFAINADAFKRKYTLKAFIRMLIDCWRQLEGRRWRGEEGWTLFTETLINKFQYRRWPLIKLNLLSEVEFAETSEPCVILIHPVEFNEPNLLIYSGYVWNSRKYIVN